MGRLMVPALLMKHAASPSKQVCLKCQSLSVNITSGYLFTPRTLICASMAELLPTTNIFVHVCSAIRWIVKFDYVNVRVQGPASASFCPLCTSILL